VIVGTGDVTTTEHLGVRSSYIYQLEELIRAQRGGAPMPTGPDDAVATAELIDRCYRAAGLPLRPRATLAPASTERRS
jgi:predicted dehydrogenase